MGMEHGEKEKKLSHAMRYAVQLLITTPDSKGKPEILNQIIKLELFVIDR